MPGLVSKSHCVDVRLITGTKKNFIERGQGDRSKFQLSQRFAGKKIYQTIIYIVISARCEHSITFYEINY